MEQLAKTLLSLKGLSISQEQARTVSNLYDQLDSYDKKPLVFTKQYSNRARGRFARSRRHVEDASIDYIKRCLIADLYAHVYCISVGAFCLLGHQHHALHVVVVEALCILLCEKYPHPRKEPNSRAYISR